MTFDQALAAARATPRSARRAAEVKRAEASLLTARTHPCNPETTIEAADRRGVDVPDTVALCATLGGSLSGMDWLDEPEVKR